MEHQKAKNLLSLYIDGRVDDNDRRELEDHLKSCRSCRAELESLRAVASALGRLPVEKMPDDAADRLRRRLGLSETEKRPLLPRLVFSPLLPAAAIALILAISVTVISLNQVPMVTSPQYELKSAPGPAIVADVPEKPSEKSANTFSPPEPGAEGAPEKDEIRRSPLQQPDEGNLSLATEEPGLIFSDKNYTPEELEPLFAIEKTIEGNFDLLKKEFIKDAGSKGEELSRVFDAIMEKYPAAELVYTERARFHDKEAWIILIQTGGVKRVIVFS